MKSIPNDISTQKNGVQVYTVGGKKYAVIKKDGKYRLYDYETGRITKGLTASKMNRLLKEMKKSEKSLKTDSGSDIINNTETENGNESKDGLRLRDSGKRNGSKNTERQVSRVESGAGQAEGREKLPESQTKTQLASLMKGEK